MPYTTKADEKISHSCPLTDSLTHSLTHAQDDSKSELCSSLKMSLEVEQDCRLPKKKSGLGKLKGEKMCGETVKKGGSSG